MAPLPLERLKEIIAVTDSHTEDECTKILASEFPEVLLPFGETIVLVDKQYTTESGRADIVVIVDRTILDGSEERAAYVWELKAPQVAIFARETNSRVRPSDELYSAENQLLNYHASLAGSDEFRSRWRISRREHVCIGGIVIGTKGNFVACSIQERPGLTALARTTLEVRKQNFYKNCHLQLLTWDEIVQRAPLLSNSNKKISQ